MTAPSRAFTAFTTFTYQPFDLMLNRITKSKLISLIVYHYHKIVNYIYYRCYNYDTVKENTKRYKQVLIDVDNYNALKDLGKAGDSFNDVITTMLCLIGTKENKSNSVTRKESVIRIYPEDHYFKVLIDSGLRKAGVDHIVGFKEYMNITFLADEYEVRINYPELLENLAQEVESELLDCDMGLPNYVISRIVNYIQENVAGDIKNVIKQL